MKCCWRRKKEKANNEEEDGSGNKDIICQRQRKEKKGKTCVHQEPLFILGKRGNAYRSPLSGFFDIHQRTFLPIKKIPVMGNDGVVVADTPTHMRDQTYLCTQNHVFSFVMGHYSQKGICFFFSRAELSWSLNIKVRSSPAPCIIAHFILLSFFPSTWYHHTHQQEAVLQPSSETSLLLGRTIHITTTVYSTGYTILQLGVHTVAKIWNKESHQQER